jgi:4'-phosphopantetheinyl transferase
MNLWRIDIDPPDHQLEALRMMLSNEELAKANRYKFEKNRRRWIAGRGTLRTILSGLFDKEPSSIVFGCEPNGQPYILSDPSQGLVHFNRMWHFRGNEYV